MKKLNVAIITALLGLGLGASAVFAEAPADQPKGDRAEKMQARLKAADKDGDGKISRAESAALPRIAKHFDEIDTNKDGFLTHEEMKAFHQKQRANHPKPA
jgi:Ca2+-binding EF-hand superfamily protein